MTGSLKMTGAPSTQYKTWNSIDWSLVKQRVWRLQVRIAKATREGKHGKAKSLQWILTHSYYGKLLAIKRVTSNSGRKTPGVDGILWKTDKQKIEAAHSLKRSGYRPLPLRRVLIPKSDGKSMRPLGIPSMRCRAYQALHLLALEPVAETLSDRNSYGFRPKRSCADAIEKCFKSLSKKGASTYVLEGDIKACFDEISHEWLLKNIPMDRRILGKWLKCGAINNGNFFPTNKGTPQGGIISPTLLNLTLSGLEQRIAEATVRRDRVHLAVYADATSQ
jgi:RNA-directed DNA polymerase